MKRWALAGVLVALAACKPETRQTPDGAVRLYVREAARVPEAVEFRAVTVFQGTHAGGRGVCGEWRGRNGFGGMSFWTRFVAGVEQAGSNWRVAYFRTEDDDGRGTFSGDWQTICRNRSS